MRLNCEQNRSITADWPSLPAWFSDEAIGKKKKKKRKNAPRIGDYRQSRRQGGTKGGEGEGETLTLFIMCFISTLVCVCVIYTQIRSTQTVDTPTDDCEIHVL